MNLKDFGATVATWVTFGATLLVYDPLCRLARLGGEKPLSRVIASMCRGLCRSISAGGGRLVVEGRENLPQDKECRLIVICNHQSLVESFYPLWALADYQPRYIAKKVLGRYIPSVSFFLRRGGNCLIDRADREGALEGIRSLGRRLHKKEISVIIFPEGTRSTDGHMHRMKNGGLKALLREAPEAPVLPMVICGGDRVFPKGSPHVQAGSLVKVGFLPIIERNHSEINQGGDISLTAAPGPEEAPATSMQGEGATVRENVQDGLESEVEKTASLALKALAEGFEKMHSAYALDK